jgi:hypothetical protein
LPNSSSLLSSYPWGIGLAAGGAAITAMYVTEGFATMEGQHWIMLVIILVVGYVLGRLWTTPAQMLGLP